MSKNSNQTIKIYTDGCCNGTPGTGGWACIIDEPDRARVELSGAFNTTTNNRMEIMAVLRALQYIQEADKIIVIYSDSQYVCNSINKWMINWELKNFEEKKNADLWKQMCDIKRVHPKMYAEWVKGHNGHPENERCDELAEIATYADRIPKDEICAQNYLNQRTHQ